MIKTKESEIEHPVHPKVRTIISKCVRGAVFFVGTRPGHRELTRDDEQKVSKLNPKRRSLVFSEAAGAAEYMRREEPGLTASEKVQLGRVSNRMGEIATYFQKKYPLK